jgi:outer membrane protein assembly factor BamE
MNSHPKTHRLRQMVCRRLTLATLALVTVLGLPGCVYRLDVQQGNELTADMIAEIKPGMTRREVVKILGYPLISDPFNRNRWDYFYSFKSGKSRQITRYSAKLRFEGDYLSTIESDIPAADNPAESPDAD